MENTEMSPQEKKVRKITTMYYSRPEIQKAIFDFSRDREISPRYFEGFGKRPDSLQFKGDVLSLSKKGATSFHCSEEIWKDPLEIKTGMTEKEYNELRTGWDLLVDIDCEEGMDYSARVAKATIEALHQNGIQNIGIKFSGNKGFHVIVPWKAFPKNINGVETKNLFPELPRIIMAYLRKCSSASLEKDLPKDFHEKFKDRIENRRHKCNQCGKVVDKFWKIEFSCKNCNIVEIKSFKNGKGPLPKCYKCKEKMMHKPLEEFFICHGCEINSQDKPTNFKIEEVDLFHLMGLDMALVSPRHLFRMPYSLHEKSSLVSVVIDEKDLDEFIKDKNYAKKIADPLRIEIKPFMPDSVENEAAEFVMQAYDWAEESGLNKEINERAEGKYANFKPIKLEGIKDDQFPPCVKKILEGMVDGKKRGLFVLINLFRSIGMEKEELEKRIFEWNEKNETPLKKGYITGQLSWGYKRKPIMPPNCREFYQNLGVCDPDKTCAKIKNPINYVMKRNYFENNKNDFGNEKKVNKKTENSEKRKKSK